MASLLPFHLFKFQSPNRNQNSILGKKSHQIIFLFEVPQWFLFTCLIKSKVLATGFCAPKDLAPASLPTITSLPVPTVYYTPFTLPFFRFLKQDKLFSVTCSSFSLKSFPLSTTSCHNSNITFLERTSLTVFSE